MSESNNFQEVPNGTAGMGPIFRNTPCLYLMLFAWQIVGLLVMGGLIICSCEVIPGDFFLAKIVPLVGSVLHAKVFNQELAFQHFAIMYSLSPALILTAWFLPPSEKEYKALIKKPEVALLGSFVMLGLFLISALLDFYTGILTLGLARTLIGFTILSSFVSSFFAIAIRYLKLSTSMDKEPS